MIKVMLLIILSPFAIFCAILSMSIIYAILDKIIEIICKEINDLINNRDDNRC